MLYPFAKEAASHLNLDLALRTLRDVRMAPTLTFLFNYLAQEYEVQRQEHLGIIIPTAMDLEISTYCPRRCKGCYVPLEERRDSAIISYDTAHLAIRKGVEMGMRNFNFIGGEPLRKETIPLIESIVNKYPLRNFFCCTNGELLATDQSSVDGLISKHNFSVALSLDGSQAANDGLRGKKSYDQVVDAAEYLRHKDCFYGGVVTVREANFDDALDPKFTDFLVQKGLVYALFAITDSLSPEYKQEALVRIRALRSKPIFIYNSLTGHPGEDSRSCMAREVCVNKKGEILTNRKDRRVMGRITDLDLKEAASHPDWKKRF
jgi:sulfatase maturation enzyme AslB (radical SAM superfamily)